MNKKMIRIAGWALGLSMAVAGIGIVAGTTNLASTAVLADYAGATAATMAAGTNGSSATVNGKNAIKVGTSSKGGNMTITVPTGANHLYFYAAAWKDVTGLSLNLTLSTNGASASVTSFALTADSGVSNNTPFTLSGQESNYLFETALSGITAQTTVTLTSSIAKRFVVWGAKYEVPSVDTPSISVSPESITMCTADQTGKTASVVPTGFGEGTLHYSWTTEDSNISLENDDTAVVTVLPNAAVAGSATISVSVWGGDVAEADALTDTLNVALTTPITVADALELSGHNNIYTKGIVSQIDSISTKYGNATYYISDDGTTSKQLEIFRGKYLNDQSFTSEDQLQLGDRVVVYGNIVTYNDIVEYDQGNYLVSLVSEPRLSLSANEITVTLGTEQTVTATPANFASGIVTYSFDENPCASLSFEENTITVHGNAVGSHTFTVTGLAGGVAQTTAELTVNVVAPYPTQISKSGYTSFTDTQTFAEGTGSVTITYSDGNKATKHLGDAGVKLLISDVEVSADTSTANYVGANSAKIAYTEGGHTVETNSFTLNVNAELAVTSFEGVPEYLIIDSEDPAHSATVTVNYKSLNGAPELSVVSSNPTKLPVSFDESDNVYDEGSKTGVATFDITAGTTAGQYSVTVSATYGNRTESKSFSINVRGEAPAASEGSYQKALELSDLENGNYVIAANTGSVFGMTRSLSGGKYAFSSALTVTDNKISGATGDEINYYLTVAGTDNSRTATIKNLSNNKYVTYNGSTNLGEADSAYDWTITKQSSGVFRITSVATPARGLVARAGSYDVFGGYAVTNVNSTEYFDLTLFKYVEPAASSFDLVDGFVTNYMHMNDVSIGNGSDTGACKGNSGYYLTAKRAWNTMIKGYEGEDNLQAVFSTSFEDAYARYNAWAVAMNDAAPFDENDEVVSFIRNALVNRALDASTSLPLVVTVAALGTAAAAGFFLFQRKRKEF